MVTKQFLVPTPHPSAAFGQGQESCLCLLLCPCPLCHLRASGPAGCPRHTGGWRPGPQTPQEAQQCPGAGPHLDLAFALRGHFRPPHRPLLQHPHWACPPLPAPQSSRWPLSVRLGGWGGGAGPCSVRDVGMGAGPSASCCSSPWGSGGDFPGHPHSPREGEGALVSHRPGAGARG